MKMKDYVDQQMKGVITHQDENSYQDVDFERGFQNFECPFCQNKNFLATPRDTPNGRTIFHLCADCSGNWYIEFNDTTGEINFGDFEFDFNPDQ